MSEAYAAPALLEAHPETNEARVLELVYALEIPLLEAAQAEYPEKGWRMCGPTSIVLGHLLSVYTDIPLKSREDIPSRHVNLGWGSSSDLHVGMQEYFEFKNYLYLPPNEAGYSPPDEHTLLLYHTGQRDEIITIDPVYNMLWGTEKTPAQHRTAMGFEIACLDSQDFYSRMAAIYSLHKFSKAKAAEIVPLKYIHGYNDAATERKDMLIAMHGGDVFNNTFVGDSGTPYDVSAFWGDRLCRVMDAAVRALPNIL